MARKEETIPIQCAWCNRVLVGGKWEPYPEHMPEASHGMCPECSRRLEKQWGLERKGNPMAGRKDPMAGRKDPLIGARIVAIRPGTAEEKRTMMWYHDFVVIELDTGALIFATSDEEMNDAGVLNYSHLGTVYTIIKQRG